MNDEHMMGAADFATGVMKVAKGLQSCDVKLQAEGRIDIAMGAIHDAVGDAKDAAAEARDNLSYTEPFRLHPVEAGNSEGEAR
jgi:uncharacterized protein YjbJ (UPF0337 family)